jgi:hypothetical protein
MIVRNKRLKMDVLRCECIFSIAVIQQTISTYVEDHWEEGLRDVPLDAIREMVTIP